MKKHFRIIVLFSIVLMSVFILNSCDKENTDLIFTQLEDGSYSVEISSTSENQEIIIPERYKGKSVTTISDNGFFFAKIHSLTIPSSIKKIGENAFFNAAIENLYIEDFNSWFYIDFVSANSNPMYSSRNLYIESQKLKNYQLSVPEGIECIKKHSLLGNYVSLVLPSTVKTIEDNSIFSPVEIINKSSVHLKEDSLAIIGTVLEIHNDNSKLDFADDYIFYEKDSVVYLVRYVGSNFSIILPDDHNGKRYVIYDHAFSNNTNLISITLSNGVISISENASNMFIVEIVNNSSLRPGDIPFYTFHNHNGKSLLEKYEDFWFYKKDDQYYLVRYTGQDENIILPEYFNHQTYIVCSGAFSVNYHIKSIHIPKTIYEIEVSAFGSSIQNFSVDPENIAFKSIEGSLYSWDEKNLIRYASGKNDTHFTIPDKVTIICDNAFTGSKNLRTVTLSESVEVIGNVAFAYCYNLEEIVLSNSLRKIGYLAFMHCISLNTINLPEGLISIDSSAFESCTVLKEVNIPSTLKYLGSFAFSNCHNIKSINVHVNNEKYTDIDGNLYSKDGTILIFYSPKKDDLHFDIPNGVTTISGLAFEGCNKLKSVVIPNTLNKVTGSNIFRDSSVETIYYYGTEEDWDSINLYDRDEIEKLNVYFYSYKKPLENGMYWHYNSYRIPIPWN